MDSTQEKKDAGLPFGDETHYDGIIHISEDVIVELTKKTILGIPNIQAANTRLSSKFGIGRKGGDGIRVSVEDGLSPMITVDAYVLMKYGQRIPDLAWDVQEKVKANLERYTGYTVKAVNVNVQGIYLENPPLLDEAEGSAAPSEADAEAVEAPSGEGEAPKADEGAGRTEEQA